jgi:hypothetical protein
MDCFRRWLTIGSLISLRWSAIGQWLSGWQRGLGLSAVSVLRNILRKLEILIKLRNIIQRQQNKPANRGKTRKRMISSTTLALSIKLQ